jgi:magnesium transporter
VIETYREVAGGLLEVYVSAMSQRTNEVMRVLTIIATIFMPLTFIAGIYGMNFNPDRSPLNMPELNWFYGYPFSLGLMTVTALILLYYFKRKKWLGRAARRVRVPARPPASRAKPP